MNIFCFFLCLATNSSPQKASFEIKEQFTNQQQNAVTNAHTKTHIPSSLNNGLTTSEAIHPIAHLERSIPKPAIQNIYPGQMGNSTGGGPAFITTNSPDAT